MAEKKYLDSGGLTTLVSNIKSKVETITNQLDNKKATKDELASAESRITAAEKDIDAAEVLLQSISSKLGGISSGAEVNQNAFSNVKVGSTTVAADAKQDTLELVQGSAIVIDADTANDKISISHDKEGPASGYTSGNTTTSISGSGGSGTIKIPQLTIDKYGHVTAAADENVTITMPTIPTHNAFSNVKVGSTTVVADGPSDTVEFIANDPISISGDATNDKVAISHVKKGPSAGYTSGNTTTSISGSGGSGTIKIPQLTVDAYGHVTAAADENVTITIPTIPTVPNSFSNVKVGSTTVEADVKQDTLELVQGSAIVIGADAANDKISISHEEEGPSSGYTSGNTTTSISGSGGSGTIKIPQLTVDKYGHVTAAADESVTITMPTIPTIPTIPNSFANVKVGSTTVAADAKQDTLELIAGDNIAISADAVTDKISISTTAEVNQNAFSNVKVGSTTVAADAKQDTLELVQGSAIVLGADVANDKISISHDKEGPASGYTSGNTTTSISGSGGSGTIKIPQLTVDKYGHVTSAADENVTITIPTIPTIPTALKNPKALKFGSKTYDGSVEAEITAADLGLASALKYHGTTTTAISDGATTNPIVIGGSNHTATQGCVVAYGKKEFVWTGSVWEELGNEGNYKVVQTAVSSPSASGSTTAFIDTISQDTNGKITVTKKNVSFPSSITGNAGTATKLATARTITIGNKGKSFDGSGDVSWTLSEIGAAASSHGTHVTYSTDNPKVAGTASAGSSNNVSRGDHVHPAQTSVSGNAGTATKLATARTIGLGTGATGTATSFDGSGNITIPVTDIKEAYLSWGGKNYNGDYGPIDAAMVPQLGANRLAFLNPDAVLVEYSTNGGSSWSTYSAANWQKVQLFNGQQGGANLTIGGASQTGVDKTKHMVRITITTERQVYTTLNKFVIYVSTNGSSGCYCTITARTQANVKSNTNTWTTFANNINISGWSGYNVINTDGITTYGNSDSQYGQVRFTFGISTHNQTYGGLSILSIMGFGGVGHATPSNLAARGTIYSYDWQQNVTFPAKVTATTLSGSLDASNLTGTVAKARLGAHSHAYTPTGTIGSTTATGTIGNATAGGSVSSSFTGTAHNHGFTGTAHKHTFTGTAHKHTFTGTATTSGGPSGTTSVYSITGVGSLPSCTLPSTTVSYSNGELSITHNVGSFSAGSLPSRSEVTVASSNHTHSVTATGTIGNTTAGGSLNEVAATGTIGNTTAGGSVSSTFTGTAHNHSFTGTAHNHSFTGTAGTATTIS